MELKVATYNIHKAVGLDQRRKPERILAVLNEIDADIIALQEVDRRFGQRATALPREMIEGETPWMPVPLDFKPKAIGWHGNSIFVRRGVDIKHAGPIPMPCLEPRGAVMAELLIEGRMVRVIGVHLDLSGLWRRRQIKSLLKTIDHLPHHPTILMGDFNQWSDRGALSEFAFHRHRIVQTPRSYHSARPVARLDRIIVSHDCDVLEAGCNMSDLSRVASDHLPVWARLHLK